MSFNARLNALDQLLDIQGSSRQEQNRTLTDEFNQLGHIRSGVTSAVAQLIAGAPAGQMRVSASAIFDNVTNSDLTNFLKVSGAASGSNNGVFLIVNVVNANTVDVVNASAIVPDPNNGAITVQEYFPYSLEDDMNYVRTDRAAIKGTANWYDGIPTYQRPTAIGTNVTASLQNIAGKTTDAVSYNVNRTTRSVIVASGSNAVYLSSSNGAYKHSDAVDKTGVPCFDATGTPFVGDWQSCYVEINDVTLDNELHVLSGAHAGEKIFGLTVSGSSTGSNMVQVNFYSVPDGGDISTQATAFSWQAGLPLTATFVYGFNQRLDQLDVNAFRTMQTLGIQNDASLRKDISDIQSVIGEAEGAVSLAGLLTNTGNFFPFSALSATPSVVQALNALNQNIGNETYTGPYLTNGSTVTAALQSLSNAISAVTASTVTRYLTRLTGTVPAGVAIPVPAPYAQDGTNQGKGLAVFTAGLLRDPGTAANGDDYTETTTGSVTFFRKNNVGTHINWFVL